MGAAGVVGTAGTGATGVTALEAARMEVVGTGARGGGGDGGRRGKDSSGGGGWWLRSDASEADSPSKGITNPFQTLIKFRIQLFNYLLELLVQPVVQELLHLCRR